MKGELSSATVVVVETIQDRERDYVVSDLAGVLNVSWWTFPMTESKAPRGVAAQGRRARVYSGALLSWGGEVIANRKFWERLSEARRGSPLFDAGRAAQFIREEPIVFVDGALVFKNLSGGLFRSSFPDLSGYESLANKIHVDDFIPGTSDEVFLGAVEACEVLVERLKEWALPFNVVLSDSAPGGPVVRFYLQREGEIVHDHPDEYLFEAIAIWSWRPESDGKRNRNP